MLVFLICKLTKSNSFVVRYTHVEAEFPFINFNDLLDRIEDMICDVVKRVLESPHAEIVKQLNPVSFCCLPMLCIINICLLKNL